MSDTPHISLKKNEQFSRRIPKMVVFGVGGGGCNAVNNMIDKDIKGVEFIAANTDLQHLESSKANKIIQLGKTTTNGQGAGSFPEVGLASAEEAKDEIIEALQGTELLFLTAGMGGGTGTGAAPYIAKLAKEMDILIVAVVTKPFKYESEIRMQIAENGIEELEKYVDTMIVLPNEHLFRIANKDTTLQDSYKASDNVLYLGVRGITDLIASTGFVNLDFADVKMVIKKRGRAIMGMGEAEGENRAIRAVEEALANPLLEDSNIRGATGVLINITGSPDITLFEFQEAAEKIKEEIGDSGAIIKVGTAFLKELEGKIRVSIFATGIKEQEKQKLENNFPLNNKKQKDLFVKDLESKKIIENEEEKNKETKNDFLSKHRTNVFSQDNEEYFDTGKTLDIDDEEIEKTEKSNGFFKGLFGNKENKENKEEKQENKKETKNNIFIKSKNREIEIKNNTSNDIDDDIVNIPAYLRKKKY